jgi:replicative DNA helicase
LAQGARELQQVRPNRIPPHNLDAEQSVLGAMLESQDAIANVVEILNPDDFYKPAHSEIYEATMALFNRHEAIDAITVVEELSRRGTIEGIGGRPYILGLLEAYPTASSAARYARIVEELALLRRLIRAGNEVQEIGFAMPADVADAVDTAEGIIYEVGNRRLRDELHQLKALLGENMEQIEQLYERGEHITGVSSGFSDLDDITAGFQRNNLIIVAARPAMGKSSLLNDFALAAALKRTNPVPTVIFTLEMSRHELVKRFLASEAKVDSQRINRGTLQEQDWGKLSGAMGRLAEAPIFIDDSANITLVEIRAKCRRLKAKHGLGLVIVDYLQLMQSPRRSENRQQEVSEISRNLKILARELEVPVLCASQLNRGVEMRADKRPLLGDLRESGSIEQDADLVMFLYRDEVYNRDSEARGEAELIIAKHRNGPTDTVKLAFMNQYTKFASLAKVPR